MEPIVTLTDLKQVFITAYAKIIGETPMRSDVIFEVSKLTTASLLRFRQAYAEFEQAIGSDKDMYAHWLTIQLLITTLLNGNDELLVKGFHSVTNTLAGTPAGANSDIFEGKVSNGNVVTPIVSRSYMMAILFRVYLDDIDLPPEIKEAKPAPRGRAK